MPSNTSGNQWLRTANPAFAKPVNTAAFPFCQQTPRSFPRETLYGSSPRTATSGKASEPAAKRQRLNDGVFKADSDVPHQSSAPSLLQSINSSANRASSENPEHSAQAQGSLARSNDKARRKASKSPILPIRPAKRSRSRLLSNLAISTTSLNQTLCRGIAFIGAPFQAGW